MKVRNHLKSLNSPLLDRLNVIISEAEKLLEYSQGGNHLSFTTHGLSHIRKVENNINWLLSDEDIKDFSAAEAFILICAVHFHDTFMVPKFLGDEERSRREHADKSGQALSKFKEQLGLEQVEAFYIGEVIRAHHVENISEIDEVAVLGNDTLRLQMLGAILSMADICHADFSRAPRFLSQYLSLDEESSHHWKRHMQISGMNLNNSEILLSGVCFSDDGESSVRDYGAEIEKQLGRIKPFFSEKLQLIRGVNVTIKRLQSPLDQELKFKTDSDSVIRLLIEGIYQRRDVFIRELLQNALDAIKLRKLQALKKGFPYNPSICISEIRDSENELIAIRIDDNGIGMSLIEIRDTLLTIGQTQADRHTIKTLLEESGDNVIANFGIGVLSCFSVCSNIVVRTQSATADDGIQINITNINEEIKPVDIESDTQGTTIIVYISSKYRAEFDLENIVEHYVRNIPSGLLYTDTYLSTESTDMTREQVIARSSSEGYSVPSAISDAKLVKIEGNGFTAAFQAELDSDERDFIASEGSLQILSAGIFVKEDKASNWLPKGLHILDGHIDFQSKVLDLSASRDNIRDNSKLRARKVEIYEQVPIILEQIVEASRQPKLRSSIALILARCYALWKDELKEQLLESSHNLTVELFNEKLVTIRELAMLHESVAIFYSRGNFVEQLDSYDGVNIFWDNDNRSEFQAKHAERSGIPVVNGARLDSTKNNVFIKESDLVAGVLKSCDVKVIDLVKSQKILKNIRTLGVSREVRNSIGNNIKFIEVPFSREKIGWDFDKEILLNVSNTRVRSLYEKLKEGPLSDDKSEILKIFLMLVDNKFDSALNNCLDILTNRSTTFKEEL